METFRWLNSSLSTLILFRNIISTACIYELKKNILPELKNNVFNAILSAPAKIMSQMQISTV